MTADLQELMLEVNRKFVAQRRDYESRINVLTKRMAELETKLSAKQTNIDKLTRENISLRQSRNFSAQPTDAKTRDVGIVTNSWHDILEQELKQRIEAFVELCQQGAVDENGVQTMTSFSNALSVSKIPPLNHRQRQIPPKPDHSTFTKTPSKLDRIWQEAFFDDRSQFDCSTPKAKLDSSNLNMNEETVVLNSTGFSEYSMKTLTGGRHPRIDELEQSLTRGYDELTAEAKKLTAKYRDDNLT